MKIIAPVTLPDIEERLLSSMEIAIRWGCYPEIAYKRALSLGATPIRFKGNSAKFRLTDIIAIERACEVKEVVTK
jgi:hypothetical protein